MWVDSQKLERVREPVDLAVVALAVEFGVGRSHAAAMLAEQTGYRVRCLVSGCRWVAYAVTGEVWEKAAGLAGQGATVSAAGTELLEREPWHYEAMDRDEAEMAVLCRLINAEADLGAADDAGLPRRGADAERYASMASWFGPVKAAWAAARQRQKSEATEPRP